MAAPVDFNILLTGSNSEDAYLYGSVDPNLSDADGLGLFSYQWQRSFAGGGSWVNISDANGAKYQLGDSDVGASLRLSVTYVDGSGATERAYSSPTEIIAATNDVPLGNFAILAPTLPSAPSGYTRIEPYLQNSFNAKIASFNDGGFIVVWEWVSKDDSSAAVYYERFNSSGISIDNNAVALSQNSSLPDVVLLSDGGWLVTWYDGQVSGQRFSKTGEKVGDVTQLTSFSDYEVIALKDGGWLIASQSNGSVLLQRYDAQGIPLGENINSGEGLNPSAVALNDGGWVVVYENNGIYAQKYNPDGNKSGETFRIDSERSLSVIEPSVAALSDGGWVVTWTSQVSTTNFDVHAQRYNSNGQKVGEEVTVNNSSTGTQSSSKVAGIIDGGWVVTWISEGEVEDLIYYQRYDSLGLKIDTETRVGGTSTEDSNPDISSSPDGGWLISWNMLNLGKIEEVFVQRYDQYGNEGYTSEFVWANTLDFYEDREVFVDIARLSEADPDGVGEDTTFDIQWQRYEQGNDTWVNIEGATSASYVFSDDDVGKSVRWTAFYTDNQGFVNFVNSLESGLINNINDSPFGYEIALTGQSIEDSTLVATASVESDADGLPTTVNFGYQWQVLVDVLVFEGIQFEVFEDIEGATLATFSLSDNEVGKQVRVQSSYTDLQGNVEVAYSYPTIPIINVNDLPQGTVTISGTPTEGKTLTAANTLTDEDGIGAISYQWNRDGSAITGASNSAYTLSTDDVGKKITVTASYIDDYGNYEESLSSETAIVKTASIPLFSASDSVLTSGRVHFSDARGSDSTLAVTEFRPTGTQILSVELEETTEGAVDISDVISQLNHIEGLSELTGLNKAAADNDANGSIDISDVISSLRQIVGLQDAPNARIVDPQGNHQFMFDDTVTELYVVAAGDADLSWTALDLV